MTTAMNHLEAQAFGLLLASTWKVSGGKIQLADGLLLLQEQPTEVLNGISLALRLGAKCSKLE